MTRVLALLLSLCVSFFVAAELPVPPLIGRVVDEAATLTSDQAQTLDQTLRAFEAKKGSQIAVLIVATTQPETVEQYAIRVAERWKLGRKGVDDGAILVVAKNDRTARIEVGYGLEGALNDAVSNRIISEAIVPRFRQGDFYDGIAAGVDRMIRVADGEPLPEPGTERGRDLRQFVPVIFILALVVGTALRSLLGRLPGAATTAGLVGLIAWWFAGALLIAVGAAFIAFLFTLIGGLGGLGMGRHHGGFGRGGFGDVFRGGGGRFGGGGATGRW